MSMDTYGIIGFTTDNVGIDRRFYTGRTDTDPTLAVSYNERRVDVYLNGIKLVGDHPGNSNHDYDINSQTGQGSSITLKTGVALVASDVIECIGYVSLSGNTVTSHNPTPTSGDGGFNEFRNIGQASSDLLNVYLNGVLLDDSDYTSDPTTNDGTVTIGGDTLTASDVVVIQVIGTLNNSNFVPASGGTFSGDVAVNGDLTVDTDTLVVDSSTNRVGIGTPSPNRQLNVENTIANSGGVIGLTSSDSSTSGTCGIIHFGNSTDSSLASINGQADGANDAGALLFKTEATGGAIEERMRIDSSGNVGIGTDAPATQASANTFLEIKKASGIAGLGLNGGGNSRFELISDTGDDFKILRNGSEKFKIDGSTSDATITSGNLVIGNASDKGITFQSAGGTGTSSTNNTLSEYERGTFVAKVQGSTSGSTTTSSTTSQYERIGNLVYIHINMTATVNVSLLSGELKVTGLPFNSISNSKTMGVSWHLGVTTATDDIYPWISTSTDFIRFLSQRSGSAATVGTSTAAYLYVTIAYLTS